MPRGRDDEDEKALVGVKVEVGESATLMTEGWWADRGSPLKSGWEGLTRWHIGAQ